MRSIRVSYQLISLLIFSLLWCIETKAQAPLTDFSAAYREYLPLLGINPSKLKNELAEKLDRPAIPIERMQQHLLLSLANNQLVFAQEAINHADSGLALAKNSGELWLLNYLKLAKSTALDLAGEPSTSLILANEALEWSTNNNHLSLMTKSLLTRGAAYNTLRDPIKALTDTQKAYSLAPIEDPLIAKAQIAGLIALVYEYRRENLSAIRYFEEAVDYHRKHERWRDLGDVLYGLGRANLNIGKTELGKQQLAESIEVARKVEDYQGVAYGLKELAGSEYRAENIDLADAMYSEALIIFEESQNVFTLSDVLMWLAQIQIDKGNIEPAQAYLDRAEKVINKEVMTGHHFRLEETKASAFELVGDYKSAYALLKKTYPQREKLLRSQYSKQFEELKDKFELEKLDSENRILEKEHSLTRSSLELEIRKNDYLYLFALLVIVICVLLVFILLRARQSRQEFERLSMTDELTQLANRRSVFQVLERQIDLSHRNNEPLTVAIIDLDYFKKINDQFGHGAGDKVLVAFSELCQSQIRKTDIIGRIGGEEFLIALPNTNANDALRLLNKLRELTLCLPKKYDLSELSSANEKMVSISIGLAEIQKDETQEKLFSRADTSLYKAKRNGRNQIHVAES